MSELSVAEQQIAPFYGPNCVDFLVVSPEDARHAGKMFANMCITQINEHRNALQATEWVPGFMEATLEKQARQYDGSNVKATVTAREVLSPDEARPPYFDERENTPGQILVRSQTGTGTNEQQLNFVVYSLNPNTKQVRKRTASPFDSIRLLEKHARIVEAAGGSEAVDTMFAEQIDNERANRELEEQLGVDDSILVGTAELTQLQILLDSMPVIR